jgi:isopentenyl-diphosphate delta-isomerase
MNRNLPTDRVVSSESERLILVDEDDKQVGTLDKGLCHDGKGILHRAFSVFLFNDRGELLLQRRAADKRLWPMYWSNSCCSHPRNGESMNVATGRRLADELNIDAKLLYVYKFSYQANFGTVGSENELCSVFLGRCGDKVVANKTEISAIRFVSAKTLGDELRASPDDFTPWLKLEWRQLTEEFGNVLDGFTSPA